MPRYFVLDQVLKSWLFRVLTNKVDVYFVKHNLYLFLFQFRVERAIACFFWRPYNLLCNSAGSSTPQAARGGRRREPVYQQAWLARLLRHNHGISSLLPVPLPTSQTRSPIVVEALLADPPPAAQLQGFWRCAIATAPRRAPELSYNMRIKREL